MKMQPSLLLRFAAAFLSAGLFAVDVCAQYSVSGRQLKDPNGDNIRIVGANVMTQYWDYGGNNQSVPELAKTGANAVRIFWQTSPDGGPERLRKYIQQAIDHKMIPIIALWDATGKSLTSSEFTNIINWWLRDDTRALMEEYEDYIIVNFANEAGRRNDLSTYTDRYKWAISTLRDAGYDSPFMIDAPDYADDYATMLNAAAALVNHDPQRDLVFSWHRWRAENVAITRQVMDEAFDRNICFVVGEFGPSNFNGGQNLDWRNLLAEANAKNFGWLAWVWWNPAKDINHSITRDGRFGNWKVSGWSRDVALDDANSFRNRARRTSWLENGPGSGGGNSDAFAISSPSVGQVLPTGERFTVKASAPENTDSLTFWYSTATNGWNWFGQDRSAPFEASFTVPDDVNGVRVRANGGPNDGQTLFHAVSTGSGGSDDDFAITQPVAGQSLTPGNRVTVRASAPADSQRVTFWYSTPSNGWNWVSNDSRAPFEASFTVPAGINGVRARVSGGRNDGDTLFTAVSSSSGREEGLDFAIVTPRADQRVKDGESLTVSATAPVGTSTVIFWVSTRDSDWNWVGEDSSAPYETQFLVPQNTVGVRARVVGGPSDGKEFFQPLQ